jgi:hypothetical protein
MADFKHTRAFQTQCGWPARLLGILEREAFPLVVAVMNPTFKAEEIHCYPLDGTYPSNQFKASAVADEVTNAGAERGPLSLVNLDNNFWPHYKATDFVRVVQVEDKTPMNLEQSANPFHYDGFSMGTTLVRGWIAMHDGYDHPENPMPMTRLDLVNTRSGQWISLVMGLKERS